MLLLEIASVLGIIGLLGFQVYHAVMFNKTVKAIEKLVLSGSSAETAEEKKRIIEVEVDKAKFELDNYEAETRISGQTVEAEPDNSLEKLKELRRRAKHGSRN